MVSTLPFRSLLLVAGLVVSGGETLRAQAAGAAQQVAGTIVREGNLPLPYARVTLVREAAADSAVREVLASAEGRFVLRDVPAGVYRVRARQLGFRPLEVALVVGDSTPGTLALRMERLAIALPEVVVAAAALSCADTEVRAGRDDPRLQLLRDLLVENSARISALVRSYPIEVEMERRNILIRQDGERQLVSAETLKVVGQSSDSYRPGEVLQPIRQGRRILRYQFNIPATGAVGSAAFQRTHCFAFGGEEVVNGRNTLRLLVAPDGPALRGPDVAGVFFLDPETGVLRRSELTVTSLSPRLGVSQVTSVVEYLEAIPGIAIRSLATVASWGVIRNGVLFDRDLDAVQTLGIRFVAGRPEGAPPYVRLQDASAP